ncbi:MAG TPA: alpha-amylase family protein, partial [Desulfobacterales bacterium]|nr:alpha-amylase family protein [Desulfobacterales bacterium]
TVGGRDYLREYVPHAHAAGLRVLAYVNLHWFSYVFADAHPGWEQLLADGRAYGRVNPLYGNGTTLCVNSAWRDWAYLLLAETLRTGVDGAILDGPVVFPGACHCPSCRALFRERTGAEPPTGDEAEPGALRQWQDFREWSMERFVDGARQAVQSVDPEGIVFTNAGGWTLSTVVARHPWRLEAHQHLTGAEEFVHFGAPREDLLDTSVMAKFLSAGRNPAVVFSDHALGSWHYVGMTPADLKREFYQTVSGGASPWIAVFTPALMHQRAKTMDVVAESWGFLERHEALFEGDRSAARVAVLRSETTASSYLSAQPGLLTGMGVATEKDLIATARRESAADRVALRRKCSELESQEFRGWCYLLTRQHVPFAVIREADLAAASLARFDLVVLPNAACLSDAQLAALEAYRAAGGRVVSTFETGWYTPHGELRPAGTGGMGVPRPRELAMFAPATFEEYAEITAAGAALAGFDARELLPRPEYALRTGVPEGSEALAFYLNPIGFHYRSPTGLSSHPMLLSGTAGSGWTTFQCLPGAEWMRFKVPQWERLAGSVVRRLLGDLVQLETDAPATVQVEIRAQDDPRRLLLHIVNNTGDGVFPLAAVLPAGRAVAQVRCERPTRAWSTSGREPAWSWQHGRLRLEIDVREQYEIVALEA